VIGAAKQSFPKEEKEEKRDLIVPEEISIAPTAGTRIG
jgi:hypothetical protein